MRNNKIIVSVVAGIVILASAVSYQFNNIFHTTNSSQLEVPQSSPAAKMDGVTLLSKEDIIGKLPGVYPGDLDGATTGSCGLGIMLPWKLPEPLAE